MAPGNEIKEKNKQTNKKDKIRDASSKSKFTRKILD